MPTTLFRPAFRPVFRTALLATAATLALAGCRDNDAATDAGNAVQALNVKGLSDADVAGHFEVPACTATDAQMQAGLASLGLDAASDGITWDSRELEDGGFEFDTVTLTGEDGETVVIGELDLACLREVDGEVAVDRVSAEDIAITSPDARFTVADVTVMAPDIESLRAFLDGDAEVTAGRTDIAEARAFAANGISGSFSGSNEAGSEAGEMTLESLAFAEGRNGASDGFVRVGAFTFDVPGGDAPVDVEFEGLTVTGMESLDTLLGSADGLGDGLGSVGSSVLGPLGMGYESADVGAFDAKLGTLHVFGDGMTAQNTARGGNIDMVSVMEPVTLRFTGDAGADFQPLADGLAGMGYQEIVVSARSEGRYDEEADRVVSENGFFELKDGFRMEIDSDVTGLKTLAEAAQANTGDPTAALDVLQVNGLTLRLDDNSIMERIFTFVADQQNTTPRMLRMQAKGALAMGTMMTGELGIDPEIMSDLVSALGEFIDTPDSTLVIVLDPETPLGVDGLTGLTKAGAGFSATVEK